MGSESKEEHFYMYQMWLTQFQINKNKFKSRSNTIGPNNSTSIKYIANKIKKYLEKIKIIFDLSKPEGDFDRFADFSKAKKILNWEPEISIDQGLEKTFSWVKKYLRN